MENKKGYVDSYVAFIDILGFKKFINSNGFETVYNLFTDIIDFKDITLYYCNLPKYKDKDTAVIEDSSDIKINIISDSIVISIPKASQDSFDNLLSVVNGFAFKLLTAHNLLCRGAIAEGDFYADQNIAYGPALVKAYIMENKLAVYPRIICTRNIYKSYLKMNNKIYDDDVRKNFIDLDIDDDLLYVDYMKYNLYAIGETVKSGLMKSDEAYSAYNSVKENIEYIISNETDLQIRAKYLYFKNYYNKSILAVKRLYHTFPFQCDLIFEEDSLQNNIQYKNNYQSYSNNNIINSSNTTLGENISVKIHNTDDEMEREICSILSELSLKDRSELLNMIYKFADEHKKIIHTE